MHGEKKYELGNVILLGIWSNENYRRFLKKYVWL